MFTAGEAAVADKLLRALRTALEVGEALRLPSLPVYVCNLLRLPARWLPQLWERRRHRRTPSSNADPLLTQLQYENMAAAQTRRLTV
jgi:hypothetical protein